MKLDKINDLIVKVSKCILKVSIGDIFYEELKVNIYEEKAVGYKLFIKASIIDESALNCIKSIVQKRKLKYFWTTHKSEKVFVIYTPRKA